MTASMEYGNEHILKMTEWQFVLLAAKVGVS